MVLTELILFEKWGFPEKISRSLH